MSNIESIKKYLLDLPEIKRLKELIEYFKNDEEFIEKSKKLEDLKKHIVNAREFGQVRQLAEYQREYNECEKSLSDIPFYDEYKELLEYANSKLSELSKSVENSLDNALNQ